MTYKVELINGPPNDPDAIAVEGALNEASALLDARGLASNQRASLAVALMTREIFADYCCPDHARRRTELLIKMLLIGVGMTIDAREQEEGCTRH